MTNKKMILFAVLIMVGLGIIYLLFSRGRNKMVIDVEGFEVEYTSTGRKLTIEDIYDIELKNSAYDINDRLGEPDAWIGSGMPRPVYFLKDNKVVVFHFKYPAALEELIKIVLINENGESQIIKE